MEHLLKTLYSRRNILISLMEEKLGQPLGVNEFNP